MASTRHATPVPKVLPPPPSLMYDTLSKVLSQCWFQAAHPIHAVQSTPTDALTPAIAMGRARTLTAKVGANPNQIPKAKAKQKQQRAPRKNDVIHTIDRATANDEKQNIKLLEKRLYDLTHGNVVAINRCLTLLEGKAKSRDPDVVPKCNR
eukprot:2888618-Lingulodinium_polyedra.AAC.1